MAWIHGTRIRKLSYLKSNHKTFRLIIFPFIINTALFTVINKLVYSLEKGNVLYIAEGSVELQRGTFYFVKQKFYHQ